MRRTALASFMPDVDRPLRAGLWTGLAFGLVLLALTTWEVAATSGYPSEQAEVVAVSDSSNSRPCGRGPERRQDVTWRSTKPPDRLPTEFRVVGECSDWRPGDRTRLVRVPDGNDAKVFPEPLRDHAEAGTVSAVIALLSGLAVSASLMIRLAALRLWTRVRRKGRQSRDAPM